MKQIIDWDDINKKINETNKKLKDFDWRSLKRYASPHVMDDLNRFLEEMPQHVNRSMLMAAGIAWAAAGALCLYTTVQLNHLTELRANFQDAQALSPVVPNIKNIAVRPDEVSKFVAEIDELYSGLSIQSQGSNISIKANDVNAFGQFREAINHTINGSAGWRADIQDMCVGRECPKFPLSVTLKISKVSVSNPN